MGFGNFRSFSPWKVRPYTLQMLYCRKFVKPVLSGGESEDAYQAHCEHFELILGFEAPLFEDTYENQSTLWRGNSFLGLTLQNANPGPRSFDGIQNRSRGVQQFVIRKDIFSGETDPFQISLQGKI